LRERFIEQLMVALYRSGRQAHALETYRVARQSLVDELGLEPSGRLRELEQAILRQDPALGPVSLAQRLGRTGRRPRVAAATVAGCAALLVVLVVTLGTGGQHPRRALPRPGLILLDAATGSVRANVPVGDAQGYTTFGEGFLWTMGENGIMSQVDPHRGRLVRAIPVGVTPAGVAVGARSVWVSDRNSPTLVRIDALTGQVNQRTHLSQRGLRHRVPNGGIAIDDGSLWIARGSEAIDRLDPSTLRLQHRVRLNQRGCGTAGCPLAAGGGRVWMAGGDNGTLTGIDEATNRAVATAKLRPYLCCLAVGGGSVWVAEAHGIAQLSPQGRIRRRFGVGSASVGTIAYDHGFLWATADTAGKLLRIGAHDGHVRATHLGNVLIGTAAHAGIVVANALPLVTNATHGLGPKVLRIGLTQDWLNTADPAVTRSPSGTGRWQWQLHNATCAELYRHPDAAGAAGDALQPELAAGLPQRSAGGRRWTIALRSGLRFSPPLNRPVTGEDIRASIVRALSPQLGPSAHAAGVLRSVDGLRAYRRGAKDVPGISLRRGALVVRTIRPVDDLAARWRCPTSASCPRGSPHPPVATRIPFPPRVRTTLLPTKVERWQSCVPTPDTTGREDNTSTA
jgi:Bacterial transcriptional activator domain